MVILCNYWRKTTISGFTGELYELDGMKSQPISHGSSSPVRLLQVFCILVASSYCKSFHPFSSTTTKKLRKKKHISAKDLLVLPFSTVKKVSNNCKSIKLLCNLNYHINGLILMFKMLHVWWKSQTIIRSNHHSVWLQISL